MATITDCTAIVRQLSRVRNVADSRVSTAKSTMIKSSPTNGPKTVQAQLRLPRSPVLRAPLAIVLEAYSHGGSLRQLTTSRRNG